MSTTDEEDGVDISQLEENGFMALDECGDDDEDEVIEVENHVESAEDPTDVQQDKTPPKDEAEIKEVEGHISDEKTEPGSAQDSELNGNTKVSSSGSNVVATATTTTAAAEEDDGSGELDVVSASDSKKTATPSAETQLIEIPDDDAVDEEVDIIGGEDVSDEDLDVTLSREAAQNDDSVPVTIQNGDEGDQSMATAAASEVVKQEQEPTAVEASQNNDDGNATSDAPATAAATATSTESEDSKAREPGESDACAAENKKSESGSDDATNAKKDDGDNATNPNLWVSNLSPKTRATELKTLFSKHGKVVGAKIVTNARSPGAKFFGCVTMASVEEADNCIENLNQTLLHGKHITVEKAKKDPAPNKKSGSVEKTEEKKDVTEKKESEKDERHRSGRDVHSSSRSSRSSRHGSRDRDGSSRHRDRRERDRRDRDRRAGGHRDHRDHRDRDRHHRSDNRRSRSRHRSPKSRPGENKNNKPNEDLKTETPTTNETDTTKCDPAQKQADAVEEKESDSTTVDAEKKDQTASAEGTSSETGQGADTTCDGEKQPPPDGEPPQEGSAKDADGEAAAPGDKDSNSGRERRSNSGRRSTKSRDREKHKDDEEYQKRKQRMLEMERRREREIEREAKRQREVERQQQEEAVRLQRERERLAIERMKLEREKLEAEKREVERLRREKERRDRDLLEREREREREREERRRMEQYRQDQERRHRDREQHRNRERERERVQHGRDRDRDPQQQQRRPQKRGTYESGGSGGSREEWGEAKRQALQYDATSGRFKDGAAPREPYAGADRTAGSRGEVAFDSRIRQQQQPQPQQPPPHAPTGYAQAQAGRDGPFRHAAHPRAEETRRSDAPTGQRRDTAQPQPGSRDFRDRDERYDNRQTNRFDSDRRVVLTGAASRATAAATDGFDQTGIKREGSRFSAPNPTVTRRASPSVVAGSTAGAGTGTTGHREAARSATAWTSQQQQQQQQASATGSSSTTSVGTATTVGGASRREANRFSASEPTNSALEALNKHKAAMAAAASQRREQTTRINNPFLPKKVESPPGPEHSATAGALTATSLGGTTWRGLSPALMANVTGHGVAMTKALNPGAGLLDLSGLGLADTRRKLGAGILGTAPGLQEQWRQTAAAAGMTTVLGERAVKDAASGALSTSWPPRTPEAVGVTGLSRQQVEATGTPWLQPTSLAVSQPTAAGVSSSVAAMMTRPPPGHPQQPPGAPAPAAPHPYLTPMMNHPAAAQFMSPHNQAFLASATNLMMGMGLPGAAAATVRPGEARFDAYKGVPGAQLPRY